METETREEELLEVLIAIAKRDFTKRAEISDCGSSMDALAAGINMLGEEMEYSSISLQEKEILLKEVHHRVKNNLQIISSLLNLQSSFIEDEIAKDQIRESQDRIKSMALIHEMIYQSDDLSSIEMGTYLREIASYLVRSGSPNGFHVPCHVNVEPEVCNFDIDTAIPVGLIVNELVTNSLKYAFSEVEEPELRVDVVCDCEGNCVLSVADNGSGMETNINDPDTLGLSLVQSLTEQLNGTIKLDNSNGVEITIEFTK